VLSSVNEPSRALDTAAAATLIESQPWQRTLVQ